MDNNTALFRFIKASERLPQLKEHINTRVKGKPNLGYFHTDDVGHQFYWNEWEKVNYTQTAFNAIEWLEKYIPEAVSKPKRI